MSSTETPRESAQQWRLRMLALIDLARSGDTDAFRRCGRLADRLGLPISLYDAAPIVASEEDMSGLDIIEEYVRTRAYRKKK